MQASSIIMEGRHTRSENASLSFSELLFSIDDLHLESNVSSSLDENNQNNPSILDNDFLGFFIDDEENKRRKAQAEEGIVFCGKVIDTTTTTSRNTRNNPADHKIDTKKKNSNNNNNTRLARRNSDSLCKYYSNAAAHSSSLWSASRSKSAPVFAGKKEGSSSKSSSERTSKQLAWCSGKSRFMFGSGRYPTKMELSDLRSRQLRFKHGGAGGAEEEKSSSSSSAGKRMPVLIRVLGCVGGFDDDTTMIKGSSTCVSSY